MSKFIRFVAMALSLALVAGAAAADVATFDTTTNRLTLSRVVLSDSTAFTDVRLKITSLGTVAVNNASVGNEIAFDLSTFTLRLPSITVNGQTYSKVSLTGLTFMLESVSAQIDADNDGGYNLDLLVSASGVASPAIRIANVPKPSGQSDFCSEDNYEQFQQSVSAVSGSWSITSCSFNGTSGTISALLTITSPITMSLPYSVVYTYSAR